MQVGVIMGSVSAYEGMAAAVALHEQFGGAYDKPVGRAPRQPHLLCE